MSRVILKLCAAALFLPAILVFLLYPALPARAGSIDYRPLQEDLKIYLDQQKGTYGVYIIDLNSGATSGINQLAEFHAASTFKVPLTLYIYRAVANGSLDPEKKLELRPEHREGGTGRLQFSSEGTKINIDELVHHAIVYSDNVATNMLLGLAGKDMIKDYMAGLGGQVVDHNRNVTCPKDMALYMEEVVRFARIDPWGEKLLLHLRSTIYTDRIPYSSRGVPVANKIGNWPATSTYNDVAFVSHPDRPYILSVFSRQTSGYGESVRVIREVARKVYDYQTSPRYLVDLNLDGHRLPLTDKPFVTNLGVTMVPLRAFAEAAPGISVAWHEASQVVTLAASFSGGHRYTVELDKAGGLLELIDGRSYIPLRAVCQELNLKLQWDGANNQVNLFSPQKPDTPEDNSEPE